MIKKLLLLITLAMPTAMLAQYATGSWVTHNRFVGNSITNVVDAVDKVYYLTEGNLYCFDKSTRATTALNKQNSLNDCMVSNIYYNSDKDYLVVTYDNSNIDVIAADGTVSNLPQIKDFASTSLATRVINDVTFNAQGFLVATGFGYVAYDGQGGSWSVREVVDFKKALNTVAQVGNWLIAYDSGNIYYYAPAAGAHLASSFASGASNAGVHIEPVSDNTYLLQREATLWRVTFSNPASLRNVAVTNSAGPANVQKTPTGYLANFPDKGYYIALDATGSNGQQIDGGYEMHSSCPKGNGTLWSVGQNGLHSSEAPATCYKPNGIDIERNAFWFTYNPAQKRMYLARTASNGQMPNADNASAQVNAFDGQQWTDVTAIIPGDTVRNADGSVKSVTRLGQSGTYGLVFDPKDPSTYYYSGRTDGRVYKVTNNRFVQSFTLGGMTRRYALAFDGEGNLWAAQSSKKTLNPVRVIPRARLDAGNLKSSDAVVITTPGLSTSDTFRFQSFAVSKGSDVKVFVVGDYKEPILIWDNQGRTDNKQKTKANLYWHFKDQNGYAFSWTYAYAATADRTGNVLVGFTEGLCSMDPAKAFEQDFRVNRIAQFDGIQVNSVAVDTLNRKWVGTNANGLYLLSADCGTVLKHFTNSNSPLASNLIYQLGVNDYDNSVMMVTPAGVQQYFPDSTPAAADYSHVTATPALVRPDFTGLVSIDGLMDGSTVVIRDANGNTVATLHSTGGKATWNACDANGQRVPTGYYNVFAAQGSAMPATPCLKVMVVK